MKKAIISTVITGLILFGLTASRSLASQDSLPGVYLLLLSGPATSAPNLHTLTINQQDVELIYGEEYQFTVTCLDQHGNEIHGLPVEWSVQGSDGTIDQTGRFVAPALSKTIRIIAAYNGIQGISNVTVGISDLDTDGDGISDWIEVLMGTSPTDAGDIPGPGSHYVYDDLGRILRIVRIIAGDPL